MNNVDFNLKRQILALMLMLISLGVQAADDDFITEQRTIEVSIPGTLRYSINNSEKNRILNLKLKGKLNGTDIKYIREMAGRDYNDKETGGNLAFLDMGDASIVSGGEIYLYGGHEGTMNDVVPSGMFYNCTRLIQVVLPNSAYAVCGAAFKGCCNLASVTLPSSVRYIGDEIFRGCSNLSSVTIPSGVTSIDDYVFADCTSLSNVTIPSSVTSIGNYAFQNCSSLSTITIPSGVTTIGDAIFKGCSSLSDIVLPSGVTSIGQSVFSCCSGLTSLTIPLGVTSIGNTAFYGCSGLTSLTIPSSVTSIGNDAFEFCWGVSSLYVCWEEPLYLTNFDSVFSGIHKKSCILYVPKGTVERYKASNWSSFENIVEYDVTGIDKTILSSDAKEASRYSVNGQRLTAPTKGVNIVKYSDGSVRKEIVK